MDGGNEVVIFKPAVVFRRQQLCFVLRHDERAQFSVLRRPLEYDGAQSQTIQVLTGGAARVGFLDALGKRTFRADGHASQLRRARAGQRTARDDELVFGPQRVALRGNFPVEDFSDQGAAAQIGPLRRKRFGRDGLLIQRYTQDFHEFFSSLIPAIFLASFFFCSRLPWRAIMMRCA